MTAPKPLSLVDLRAQAEGEKRRAERKLALLDESERAMKTHQVAAMGALFEMAGLAEMTREQGLGVLILMRQHLDDSFDDAERQEWLALWAAGGAAALAADATARKAERDAKAADRAEAKSLRAALKAEMATETPKGSP
jgi:hypothetical protein